MKSKLNDNNETDNDILYLLNPIEIKQIVIIRYLFILI